MNALLSKAMTFVKANRDQIIQKGLVGLGVVVGFIAIAMIGGNQETEEMVEPSDAVDEETAEVTTF